MRRVHLRILGFVAGVGIALGALLAVEWARAVPRTELLVFFERQGCVIGPATRGAARDAGFSDADIDALARRTRLVGRAETQREWLVLAPEICTIRPPAIKATLHLGDPGLGAYFAAHFSGAGVVRPGCSLDLGATVLAAQKQFGWDRDRAMLEATRLVGAALVSGEMAFYSADPNIVPAGLWLMTGECAKLPAQAAIRQSHEFLMREFDSLVRFAGSVTVCEKGALTEPALIRAKAEKLWGGQGGNAWLFAELRWIAEAAGWYGDLLARDIGTPRPPFCHYE